MVYSVKSFAHIKIYDRSNFLLVDIAENKIKTKRLRYQPRSQGSLLPVPTERERERLRVGERTWERGC